MKRTAMLLAILISMVLVALACWPRSILLVNAHILTLDDKDSVADALLMQGRYIKAVGRQERLSRDLPLFTTVVDMEGKTMLPGFVDAHSHFPSAGLAQAGLDLTPPPVGNTGTMTQLLEAITLEAETYPEGQWIVGFNYDNASLPVQRHPTRHELDKAAPGHPVYLWHRSGHMGVANTRALHLLGFHDSSVNERAELTVSVVNHEPDRDMQGRLTGLLQESAAPRLSFLLRQLPYRSLFDTVLSARDQYLHNGITTVQNGFADKPSMLMLRWLQRLNVLPQRIVVWPAYDKMASQITLPLTTSPPASPSKALADAIGWRGRSQRFSLSALKLVVDGSPQGRTAWLSEPYLTDTSLPVGFRGVPSMPEVIFKKLVLRYHSAGFQLAMHANGDAAIDLVIASLTAAHRQTPRADSRHLIVHAQTIRQDQLEALARLGASATFFPAHTYYWGDWYRTRVLGDARASRISPLAQADLAQLRYSIHSDAPVTPVSPMSMLWSATQRLTLEEHVLGPSLVIDRMRALRAMTIDAAWQNYLEQDRGSLEVGKLADIIALTGDPLTEPDVRDLQVQRVWIGGKEAFRR